MLKNNRVIISGNVMWPRNLIFSLALSLTLSLSLSLSLSMQTAITKGYYAFCIKLLQILFCGREKREIREISRWERGRVSIVWLHWLTSGFKSSVMMAGNALHGSASPRVHVVAHRLPEVASRSLTWPPGTSLGSQEPHLAPSCSSSGFPSPSGVFTLSVLTMHVGRCRFCMRISCCRSCFSSSIWDLRSEFIIANRSDSWGTRGCQGRTRRNRELLQRRQPHWKLTICR